MTAPPAPAPHRRCEGDEGSAAVELTLLVPLVVALLLLVVAAGRLTSARLAVHEAAHQAARTLTLAADPGAARDRATATARTVAGSKHLRCARLDVAVDVPATPTGPDAPLQVTTVTVTCTLPLTDLTGLALPASTTVTATATSPLDRYRSTP